MPIAGFDYQGFAQNLAQQAQELIPADFNEAQRNYVANTLANFSMIAGQALNDDTESNFNLDQAMMITQIIAEWSYHKSVDLVRSGIPQQYWDPIMQKIAFTIFEISKNAFKQSLPQDQILQLIEHHVKKTYLDSIAELKEKNLIDDGLMERAASQSNIDAMMQQQAEAQAQQEQQQQSQDVQMPAQSQGRTSQPVASMPSGENTKVLKLATLALLFQKMKQDKVQTILNKFNPEDASSVIKFMGMSDLGQKVDPYTAMQCLQEIKTNLPTTAKALSPTKIVNKIQNISQYVERPQLEQMLKLERPKVKRLVFNALEGEYYEVAPKVANIIATHIEDSV
ncbi:MAG: hypothetical protein ACLSWI_09765 [Candidatus Gastranaerophilaceae bacterium]